MAIAARVKQAETTRNTFSSIQSRVQSEFRTWIQGGCKPKFQDNNDNDSSYRSVSPKKNTPSSNIRLALSSNEAEEQSVKQAMLVDRPNTE